MNINRSNYEICLIDWLDGNLNSLQVEQLELFLSENPDLKKEFEDLSTINLKPSKKSFPGKSLLKKTTSELTGSQFEYLCIASLEDDITTSQEAELREIIEQYPEKKKTFELIQRTKLSPVAVIYPHKNQLIKRSLTQRVIRLSVIGLSAAAAVALIVMTYFIIPRNLDVKSKDGILSVSSNTSKDRASKDETFSVSSNNIVTDSSLKLSNKNVPEKIFYDKNPVGPKQNLGNKLALSQKKNSEIPKSVSISTIPGETILSIPSNTGLQLDKIMVSAAIGLKGNITNNRLVALKFPHLVPDNNEERSNVGRFISKNFRELFLKEKSPKDSPLRGYEIAEAGVTGLNKLFGWEMALSCINDEKGELRSVYFSSKILKFNAPVKKTEPQK